MDREKLPQVQLRRIEKHIESIIYTKNQEIYKTYNEEEEKAKNKIQQIKEIKVFQEKEKSLEKERERLNKKYHCNIYTDNVRINWDYKNSEALKKRDDALKKIIEAHKKFTEQLLFGDKPSILKMIRDLEKL